MCEQVCGTLADKLKDVPCACHIQFFILNSTSAVAIVFCKRIMKLSLSQLRDIPTKVKFIHDKAIAWMKSKLSCISEDKIAYKASASKCSDAMKKYHAAKELEMILFHSVGTL